MKKPVVTPFSSACIPAAAVKTAAFKNISLFFLTP